ncbi:MAG TPA: acetyl-CoA carboxylase biotin carboxyl carrier protein [Pyrinomonadaceae bacterium]|jgi:acetyl-CoA carboxylase biotin carboxyl carrier protein|nr:acetyl-CoA carboxylase biotin carboxyl carrier protein [Pyrinomonadaceae bacterium]
MSAGVKQAMSNQESQQPGGEQSNESRSERGHRDRDRGRRRHRPLPKHLEASINMDELRELIGLITDNALTDFELQREGFHVKVGRNLYPNQPPVAPVLPPVESHAIPTSTQNAVQSVPHTTPPHPGAQAEEAASEDQGLHLITSPIVGTFYRSPSPNAESFVRIGSHVESDTVVCIIEAMKLMNEIQAETSGEVVKIYVENGQAVEFGQPLFGIRQQ